MALVHIESPSPLGGLPIGLMRCGAWVGPSGRTTPDDDAEPCENCVWHFIDEYGHLPPFLADEDEEFADEDEFDPDDEIAYD